MTTRKLKVAHIMKMCIDDSHNLGKLHKLFLKEILQNRTFCLQKPNAVEPELSEVVEIVGERSKFKKFPTHTQDHGDV